MSISTVGNGLSIIISCDYTPHHDWMAFLCWYSMKKNLPDANIMVSCRRNISGCDILSWTRRCNLPLLFHKCQNAQDETEHILLNKKSKIALPVLHVPADFICLRDFDEGNFDRSSFDALKIIFANDTPELVSDCKQENHTVFVDYKNGWGKFVTSSWINKFSTPLDTVSSYVKHGMTVNETRLGHLWESAARIYQSVSRG